MPHVTLNYTRDLPCTSNRQSGFDRLRVDQGETAFWEGRLFRSFLRLNFTETLVIRATVGVGTILRGLRVVLTDGTLNLTTKVGGTPGGVFGNALPIFGMNNLVDPRDRRKDYGALGDSFYATQNLLESGGTHTGGTELDFLTVKAAGAGGPQGQVGATGSSDSFRGIAIGTYYWVLESPVDPVVGVFNLEWEERPATTP